MALHKNGVEFRQQFNGDVCTRLATLYGDVQRRATQTKIITYTRHTGTEKLLIEQGCPR